jgi:hypothetical protein
MNVHPGVRPKIVAGALVLLLILLGVVLRENANLGRPLEQDELHTLKAYTALGYEATSDEMKQVPSFDASRLIKGLYKTWANPWGPNHHIVHSLAVTTAESLMGFGERRVRLPALIASLALVAALFYLVRLWSQSIGLALLVALPSVLHPYFLYYGQTARGYSLAVLLVIAHIAIVDRQLLFPNWKWHVVSGMVSVVAFLNLVTTLTMWLVPLYAVLLIRGPDRRGWCLESLAVFGIIGIFIASHFPIFLYTQAVYGVPLSDFIHEWRAGWWDFFSPGWWGMTLLLGIVGLFIGCWRKKWLSWVTIGGFVFILILAFASQKLPYARTFGCFLVLSWLGLIPLWQALPTWRKAMTVVLALPCLFQLQGAIDYRSEPTYSSAMQVIGNQLSKDQFLKCVLLPWVWGEEARYYLPPHSELPPFGTGLRTGTLFVPGEMLEDRIAFRTQSSDRTRQEYEFWLLPVAWERFVCWKDRQLRALCVPVNWKSGSPDDYQEGTAGVLFWQPMDQYFDFARYTADRLKNEVGEQRLRRSAIRYLSPGMIMVFFSSADQFHKARALVNDLEMRSPGRAVWGYRTD